MVGVSIVRTDTCSRCGRRHGSRGLLLPRLHSSSAWTGDATVWVPTMLNCWVYRRCDARCGARTAHNFMAERPDLREELGR